MAIEFYLIPNQMTNDPDDYMAISSNAESYRIEDVFDHMTREGSTITKAEALAGFEEIVGGIVNLIEKGHAVITPLVNISSGVSGVFEGENDTFDSSRHQIRINVTAGKRLREISEDIAIEKVTARKRQPKPLHFIDNSTQIQDDVATPTAGARITGSLLKYDESDSTQGIFFVNTADSSETKVDSPILRNMPGELIFVNPQLTAGTYRLEVRSILKGTSSIRTGVLSKQLIVS
ncbi:MAG: DNA-binding domain-containing protein [Bacteroidota bacterium]